MTRKFARTRGPGYVSNSRWKHRDQLVKKGLASWYTPWRTLTGAIEASGIP